MIFYGMHKAVNVPRKRAPYHKISAAMLFVFLLADIYFYTFFYLQVYVNFYGRKKSLSSSPNSLFWAKELSELVFLVDWHVIVDK